MALTALVAIHVLLPQRSGFLALSAVMEPYLVLAGLVATAAALLSRGRPAIYLAAAFVVVALLRYEPLLLSPGGAAGPPDLTVTTWNVLAGPGTAQRTLDGLALVDDADLVGLVELQPALADALAQPALLARYPQRVLAPHYSVLGIGLLSRHPIIEQSTDHDPPHLRALVATPGTAEPTAVYVVHPLPARIGTLGPLPVTLDTTRRDAAIAELRAMIEADLQAGRPVIVLGDLNATEREPAYAEFSAGLRDAHLDAGFGPGMTWRPGRLAGLPFGLLRIDYVFASPDFRVSSMAVACPATSDHCLVTAGLLVPDASEQRSP